jgi:trans-aconitate methyltransferase
MDTASQEYEQYLTGKYLPGRQTYLKYFFYPKILREFPDEGAIVDLGCGCGEFLAYCKMKQRGARGIDSNTWFVDICSKRGLLAENGDIVTLAGQQPASFPNAICDNVLEHLTIEEIDAFFGRISTVLAERGLLVCVVPEERGYKSDPTHKTFVTLDLISKLLVRRPLTIKKNYRHPFNMPFVGKMLYLNMRVVVLGKRGD